MPNSNSVILIAMLIRADLNGNFAVDEYSKAVKNPKSGL